MKKGPLSSLLICMFVFVCPSAFAQSRAGVNSPQEIKHILLNFRNYYAYENQQVNLAEDYAAIDAAGKTLQRGRFLSLISTGHYLPLAIGKTNGKHSFQLYQIPGKVDKDISNRLRQLGQQYEQYYKMEGTKLPPFDVVGLDGKRYTNQNTSDKLLMLKCWFIRCQVCIEEMPTLNAIVDKYEGRKDMLFLAPATDARKDLKVFLNKTKFRYVTLPGMDNFMRQGLKIQTYPTHLIVKNGKIVKVLSDVHDFEIALNQLANVRYRTH